MAYKLPTSVVVKDKQFNIRDNGDFRMVLDCFEALQDTELGEDYRVLASLIIFYNEFESLMDLAVYEEYLSELTNEMFKFMNCGDDKSPGANRDTRLIDWSNDSQLICSAINNVAKTEVRSLEYLHWWTFLGYYMSVGESTLSTVVSIRDKIAHHKKLEKWEKEFKTNNPGYFIHKQTEEEKKADELVRNLWNKGGE